jgi:hypothetical protein
MENTVGGKSILPKAVAAPSTLSRASSVADPHHLDADPDPACHFDAYPDPSFQIKAQNLDKVLQ